jgi:hypothetical protein
VELHLLVSGPYQFKIEQIMRRAEDSSPQEREAAKLMVAGYLDSYYRDAPNNIVAAEKAVEALSTDIHRHWEVCRAFRWVVDGEHLPGELMQLVVQGGGHDVWSDQEALAFLRKVYDETYPNDAIDFDELEEERLMLEKLEQQKRTP